MTDNRSPSLRPFPGRFHATPVLRLGICTTSYGGPVTTMHTLAQ
jgi:hypothetical protein